MHQPDTHPLSTGSVEQLVVCDGPVLKSIGGHLGKITRSSVSVSKSYCEVSKRGLNVNITKLFCELHSMLLLLPTAAILEISVASQKRRGKLCHLISIQSTYFVRQLKNVRVLVFISVTSLYCSGGHSPIWPPLASVS